MLALRALTVMLLVTGALQSYRRGKLTARDQRALIVILAVCALLVGAIALYVLYVSPATPSAST